MPLIKITPELLESQAKELQGKKGQHEDIYQQIKQLVMNLAQEWQGETQQAFVDTFTQKDVVFRQFSEEMERFAQFMNQAAARMRAAEEELKGQAQKLV